MWNEGERGKEFLTGKEVEQSHIIDLWGLFGGIWLLLSERLETIAGF